MRVPHGRLTALVLALALLLAGGWAHAQDYDTALAGFAKDSFGDTEAAINAVAASGNPFAAQVIEALQDGRLLFDPDDKKIYIRQKTGPLLDAATGRPAASAPAGLKPVRINNRLRRAIDAALGGLTLLASDPGKRFEAAQAVFKSRDAALLKTLDAGIAKETDARVKRALMEARAAVVLYAANA